MQQKLLDHAKQSATNALKTSSKRVIQKKQQEQLVVLIGNKIANRITGVSKSSQQNNLGTFTNEHDKEISNEIPKERYIAPGERWKIIYDLRLT